jgi:ribose transport system substrate-binding protein
MEIVASQSGDFARDKGRQVAEALLQAHPDATAIYAHNDEMAMGAIAALEAAGKVPGKDVIIVSIDGTRDALQAIVDGKLGATVECNPRFGPKAFETMARYAKGEKIEPWVKNVDKFFDASNAKEEIANAY